MKKLLATVAFVLWSTIAWGQCTGVFPNNTLCGNLSGSAAPPGIVNIGSSMVVGPVSSTLNGLPLWANTSGTLLKDGAGNTVAGGYTWSGAQIYSNTQTANGAVNFTSTFQINGNTITWPASAGTVPFIGANNTWTGSNNFTGGFQVSGVTPTFQNNTGPTVQKFTSSSGTYTTPAGVQWIRVIGCGGGGGGGGVGATTGPTGTSGGNTTFGTSIIIGNGGSGGSGTTTSGGVGAGGGGGTASLGSAIGQAYTGGSGNSGAFGGPGAGSPLVGQTPATTGTGTGVSAPAANTCAGGSGGVNNVGNYLAGGAGAGGYFDAIIVGPASTYPYAVGSNGAGGVGTGTNSETGGAGSAGIIVVEEHYNH